MYIYRTSVELLQYDEILFMLLIQFPWSAQKRTILTHKPLNEKEQRISFL